MQYKFESNTPSTINKAYTARNMSLPLISSLYNLEFYLRSNSEDRFENTHRTLINYKLSAHIKNEQSPRCHYHINNLRLSPIEEDASVLVFDYNFNLNFHMVWISPTLYLPQDYWSHYQVSSTYSNLKKLVQLYFMENLINLHLKI